MRPMHLNGKQIEHCAATLQTGAVAQFGAFGIAGYQQAFDWHVWVAATFAFLAMESLALALLGDDPPRSRWLLAAYVFGALCFMPFVLVALTPGAAFNMLDEVAIAFYVVIFLVAFGLAGLVTQGASDGAGRGGGVTP